MLRNRVEQVPATGTVFPRRNLNVISNRRRVGLILSGDRISQNAHPTPVYLDGVVVGQLSETVYSQRIDKNIALALIQADISDKQDGLAVDTGDGRRNAIIADFPFC